MTNEQILKKAIKKAIKNGWEGEGILTLAKPFNELSKKEKECFLQHCWMNWWILIFFHSFTKAFWGEEDMHEVDGEKLNEEGNATYYTLKVWQYHLQQMVLEEEPLKYIEKFLVK